MQTLQNKPHDLQWQMDSSRQKWALSFKCFSFDFVFTCLKTTAEGFVLICLLYSSYDCWNKDFVKLLHDSQFVLHIVSFLEGTVSSHGDGPPPQHPPPHPRPEKITCDFFMQHIVGNVESF